LTPSPTHRDVAALTLELCDLGRLVGGQHLGQHLVDPQLGRSPAGITRGAEAQVELAGFFLNEDTR